MSKTCNQLYEKLTGRAGDLSIGVEKIVCIDIKVSAEEKLRSHYSISEEVKRLYTDNPFANYEKLKEG